MQSKGLRAAALMAAAILAAPVESRERAEAADQFAQP
jgi:hypothetical protein